MSVAIEMAADFAITAALKWMETASRINQDRAAGRTSYTTEEWAQILKDREDAHQEALQAGERARAREAASS